MSNKTISLSLRLINGQWSHQLISTGEISISYSVTDNNFEPSLINLGQITENSPSFGQWQKQSQNQSHRASISICVIYRLLTIRLPCPIGYRYCYNGAFACCTVRISYFRFSFLLFDWISSFFFFFFLRLLIFFFCCCCCCRVSIEPTASTLQDELCLSRCYTKQDYELQ